MAVYGPRGPGYAHKQWLPYDIQDMQYWQDKANEADLMLESNIQILEAIKSFYAALSRHPDLPQLLKSGCDQHTNDFLEALEEIREEFLTQSMRAKFLVKIISGRKGLMSQHLQDQAAERMEKLNQHMEKEAKVVRIITVLTLIYLPATFVSVSVPADIISQRLICVQTFFGTDVVKFQTNDDDNNKSGSFSRPALLYWLGITSALTVVTLISALYSYRKYARSTLTLGESGKTTESSSEVDASKKWSRSQWRRLIQLSRLGKWTRQTRVTSTEMTPISNNV